jgi:hypothetical protein
MQYSAANRDISEPLVIVGDPRTIENRKIKKQINIQTDKIKFEKVII